jgi:hypothetical protein
MMTESQSASSAGPPDELPLLSMDLANTLLWNLRVKSHRRMDTNNNNVEYIVCKLSAIIFKGN